MRRNSAQTADLESDMLKRIRISSGISRTKLARDLGLSGSTAGVYVERLIAAGFLTESAKPARDAGRPPTLLHLNAQGGEFVGVDFEARSIMAVAIDFAEKPLRHSRHLIQEGDSVAVILRKIQQAIVDVLPEDPKRLLAIGFGAPGIVDAPNGIAVSYEHLPKWQNVQLGAILRKRFGVPVYLENTMRAMALAEYWFGQGKGCPDFACICIRSGMGAGIISNHQLNRGSHHCAGELGRSPQIAVSKEIATYFPSEDPAGPELQEIVSARAILRAVEIGLGQGRRSCLQALGRPPQLDDILAAAHQKDAFTLQIIALVAQTLGASLTQLVLTLDPSKIILAGQLTTLGAPFLDALRESIQFGLKRSGAPVPDLVNSTMGDYIGALGAAALALHEWKPVRAS